MRRIRDNVYVLLGDKIRRRRKELGLYQLALGRQLGVSCATIVNYERGSTRISLPHLLALCRMLDMDPVATLDEAITALPEYAWVDETRRTKGAP